MIARARARQRGHDGVLQPRGRPGRAGLRRPQPDRRARRRGDRARAPVRRGARARRARSRSRCRPRRRSTARSSPACATTSTKNGFEKVVIASSGGIDSALTVLVAVDALGADRVVTVTMPSRYSSEGTKSDARTISENLGVELLRDPDRGRPRPPTTSCSRSAFAGREPDLTEENLQARVRGNIVMALSNKFGWLVLTTGNKSEMSVGYATLYGDMAGGFAVLKDVFKQWVYRLVRWRNEQAGRELVPASVLERPPSAELRARAARRRVASALRRARRDPRGLRRGRPRRGRADRARASPRRRSERVIRMVDLAEYKRRQAPPGVKISPKAFGRDRRLPITNRWRG